MAGDSGAKAEFTCTKIATAHQTGVQSPKQIAIAVPVASKAIGSGLLGSDSTKRSSDPATDTLRMKRPTPAAPNGKLEKSLRTY